MNVVTFLAFSWKNLIESSYRWSLWINTAYDCAKMNFLLTSNRKFRSIYLTDRMSCTQQAKFSREERNEKLLKICRRLGVNVVTLSVNRYHFEHIDQFVALLSSMPNLKYLKIFNISTSGGRLQLQQELPALDQLEILDIDHSDCEIIKCFQKAKVKTFKVYLSSNSSHLEDFLRSQERLKFLSFRAMNEKQDGLAILFRNIARNDPVPFELTQLSLISFKQKDSSKDFKDLVKFLAQQTKTLERLHLGYDFPNFVYEFIFSKMTKLNTLCLYIPKCELLWNRLDEHHGIDKVVIMESHEDTYKFIPDLLKKMPNIHHLTVRANFCDNETYLAIAQCVNRVEHLAVPFLKNDLFRGVQFPNLKTLEMCRLSGVFDWNEFTESHSQLTELTIQRGFVPDERFFEILKKNCPHFKVLDLCSSVPSARRISICGETF